MGSQGQGLDWRGDEQEELEEEEEEEEDENLCRSRLLFG